MFVWEEASMFVGARFPSVPVNIIMAVPAREALTGASQVGLISACDVVRDLLSPSLVWGMEVDEAGALAGQLPFPKLE